MTLSCRLSLSVREFEDFLSQSPSLTFYIYYTIKIFLRQTDAISSEICLFRNKYRSLMRRNPFDFLPCSTSKSACSSTQKFRLKVQFQFGAELQITSGWQSTSQEGQRVGWEYPQVERNRETPRGGGGWFREDTVIICSDGFSWQFSRPLINHGKHDRERVNVVKNTRPQFQKIEGECYLTTSVAQPCGWQAFFLPYSWLCG